MLACAVPSCSLVPDRALSTCSSALQLSPATCTAQHISPSLTAAYWPCCEYSESRFQGWQALGASSCPQGPATALKMFQEQSLMPLSPEQLQHPPHPAPVFPVSLGRKPLCAMASSSGKETLAVPTSGTMGSTRWEREAKCPAGPRPGPPQPPCHLGSQCVKSEGAWVNGLCSGGCSGS